MQRKAEKDMVAAFFKVERIKIQIGTGSKESLAQGKLAMEGASL